MNAKAALLEVDGLTVSTRTDAVVVDGVTFHVMAGQTLAIVGESGSGKSITARAITGLLTPDLHMGGAVRIAGRQLDEASEGDWRDVRGSDITWLPQDPFTMLSPLRRVRDAINDNAPQPADTETLRNRLSEVGIADASILSKYPFQLSGGLRQRVGIAAALSSDPRVLVADEPTTALDVTSERKVLDLLRSIQAARGLAILLITHDLSVAMSVADRVAVMYAGRIVETFTPAELELAGPKHPYTRALLLARPPIDRKVGDLPTVRGGVPTPALRRSRCVFADRCEFAIDECIAEVPPLRPVGTRQTACIRELDLSAAASAVTRVERETTSEDLVLRASDIRKAFGSHQALAGVSIEVRKGQIVGIIGESGSGKTTLGRIIAGLETADSGTLALTAGAPARPVGRANPVQMVFQDPSGTLNPAHTVGAILRQALASGGAPSSMSDAAALLERVGLDRDMARRKAASLSGGQRQRVAIARGLAPGARVLVCDEPTSALDVMVQAQILNLLRDIRETTDVAMLFVTHDLGVARQMTDYLYVLRDGRCVEHGTTESLFESPQHEYTQTLIRLPQVHKTSLPRHPSHDLNDW